MTLVLWHSSKRIMLEPGNTVFTLMILFSLILSSYQRVNDDDLTYTYDKEPAVPVFRNTEKNITVGPGDRATLKCRVDNLGTKKITWRKSGDKHPLTIGLFTFVGDERISVDWTQRSNEWSLIIKDVKPEDEGIYICTISTKDQLANTYEVKLTVKTVQVNARESTFIQKGSTIYLECKASGKPEPPRDVEWYKDGKKIESDSVKGIYIEKKIESKVLSSNLMIKNSRLSDAGDYTCFSSNHDAAVVTIHILEVNKNPLRRGSGNINSDALHGQNGANSHVQQSKTILLLKYSILSILTSLFLWNVR